MNLILKTLASLLLFFPILSKGQENKNLNVSILLDLSDRIDPKKNPSIYQKDIEYIKSIYYGFDTHIKSKKIMLLNDYLQVYFEPAPTNLEIDNYSKKLRVYYTKNTSKTNLIETQKIVSTIPSKIYQAAIKDGNYIGSDIWRFFKTKVKLNCMKTGTRNILFILTDGYIYHKESIFNIENQTSYLSPALIRKYKLNSPSYNTVMQSKKINLIPANNGLADLEVIVLGINPAKNNPFEEDVVFKYWSDWLKSMGVKKYLLQNADLPSNIDPIIKKVILEK